MPFQQLFTKRVNDNMQDAEPSNPETMTRPINAEQHDSSMPKGKETGAFYHSEDEEDINWKKVEKSQPPRFSTIFADPAPHQEPQYPAMIEPLAQRKRRPGVFIPTPLFIFLMAVLFLETAILFAYMLFRSFESSGGMLGIGIDRQPAVNISPNFIVGGAGVVETHTVTTTILRDIHTGLLPDFVPTLSALEVSSTATTSSINPASSSKEAAAISQLLGIFGHTTSSRSLQPTSTVVITVTPTAIIPTSTVLLTVDAQGSPIGPRKTVTSIYVPGVSPRATNTKATDAGSSSVASAAAAHADSSSSGLSPSSTAAVASAETTLPSPTTSSSKSKNTFPACFGGAGAVQLNCV
ncbi:Hypothetical protein R9X50_00177100 [Acrodontium crateriforme]|uniref:Uncharacterized protein n=1 Tax=Acrodontium crateriforme TaxID=150365 RepID=A0AAQ3M1B3_9PEZI|nr:Hypothetical protein R9X50_00177100 [Acrodontium crateriforme]